MTEQHSWEAVEKALIELQGDDDGFAVEIAYWPEYPDEPWTVSITGHEAGRTGATLLEAFSLALAEPTVDGPVRVPLEEHSVADFRRGVAIGEAVGWAEAEAYLAKKGQTT